jgi:quercetin dioxygenase-like cupin family protein
MFTRALLILAAASLSTDPVGASDVRDASAKITVVFDQPLPNVPGKSMKGVLVKYGPGGSSAAHIHPNSAFIYATVLTGAIKSKVNDDPEKVYKAGENFSEVPGDRHGVSANASETEPASRLAVFVVDSDEKNLVTNLKP